LEGINKEKLIKAMMLLYGIPGRRQRMKRKKIRKELCNT
jgi:hypothetical protein